MGAVVAFLFSTVVITLLAEILPQAFFSRHALRMASLMAPVIRGYQLLLWPVARPTAWVLDRWLGPEAIPYYRERDLHQLIRLHMESSETEIDRVEGRGAINFLALDDVPLGREGEPLDPASVVTLPFDGARPRFPEIRRDPGDLFLRRSEERRVGKECRSRWSRYDQKTETNQLASVWVGMSSTGASRCLTC